MPKRYKVGDKTYNIPDEVIGGFLKDFPNAVEIGAPKPQSFFDVLGERLTDTSGFAKKEFLTTSGTPGVYKDFQAMLAGYGAGAIEKLVLGQQALTALVPHGDETPAQKLKRGKMPSEFFKGLPLQQGGMFLRGKAGEKATEIAADIGIDPILIPGFRIAKSALRDAKAITKATKPIQKIATKADDFSKLKISITANDKKVLQDFGWLPEQIDQMTPAVVKQIRQTRAPGPLAGKIAPSNAEQKVAAMEAKAAAQPLEKIAEGTPLENIDDLVGRSKLRDISAYEYMMRKDPLFISVKRGQGLSTDQITAASRKLTPDEAIRMDKDFNTGGAIVARQATHAATDDFTNIILKAMEGKVDDKIGDIAAAHTRAGRGLQSTKENIKIFEDSAEKSLINAKKNMTKEEYAKFKDVVNKHIEDIVGEDFSDRKFKEKWIRYFGDVAGIPRAAMTSMDFSMGFRQGLWTAVSHPKMFFNQWRKQFKMFGDENYFQALQKEIRNDPDYLYLKKADIDFTDLGRDISLREEAFRSNIAETITGGKYSYIRASGRAYTGLANQLRKDYGKYLINIGKEKGIPLLTKKGKPTKYLESVGIFVNTATGRGRIPTKALRESYLLLNNSIFSPKLLASRFNVISPIYYAKLHPTVRKEALKSFFKFGAYATSIAGIASQIPELDVESDPRNANFMKVRFGNTRYDLLGGYTQLIRAAAQIYDETIISSTTGKELKLGEGYKPITRLGVAGRFLAMKEAPIVSFLHGYFEGRNAIGEKFDVPTEIVNRLAPMVAQDVKDLIEDGGLGVNLGVGTTAAIFGVGVQTYGGLSTWGLSATKYPKINKELLRLNMGMGFPALSVSGSDLTNSEYKELRDATGKEIAKELTSLLGNSEYRKASDADKKFIINRNIDGIKKYMKYQVLPNKAK